MKNFFVKLRNKNRWINSLSLGIMLFLTGIIMSIATLAPISAPLYFPLIFYFLSLLMLLFRIKKRDPSGAEVLESFLRVMALSAVFGLFAYTYFVVIGTIPLLERDYSSPQGNSILFHILGTLVIFLFLFCIGRLLTLIPSLYRKIVRSEDKSKSKRLTDILRIISAALLPIVSILTIIKIIIDLVHR